MFYYFLWDEAKNNQQKAASDEILLRMNKFSAVVLIKKYIYDFLTAVSRCDLPFKPKQRKHRFIPNSFHEKKSKRKFSC